MKEELLVEALTKRKTVTVNDKLILPYSHSEVGAQPYPAALYRPSANRRLDRGFDSSGYFF